MNHNKDDDMQQKTLKTCLLFVVSGEAYPVRYSRNCDHIRPAVRPLRG